MKHIVEVVPADCPADGRRKILASAETGVDSCVVGYHRLPAGAPGQRLHTRRVDQFFYIVAGSMKVRFGNDVLDAEQGTLVFVPAGTPYAHWNEEQEEVQLLDLLIPPPAPDDVAQPAEARPVDNPRGLLRRPPTDDADAATPSAGFRLQDLAHRASGSANASIAAVELQPALGGARLHFHDFDQFYYVLEGTLDLQIGTRKMAAGPNSLVVLPAGTLHANFNAGPGLERHVTMRIPEPLAGEPLERLVEILPDKHIAR